MATRSPILPLHRAANALLGVYGPPERGVELVEAIEPVEIEYAALRRHAAILDRPERAIVEVTGSDAIGFLNRMLTQELNSLAPFTTRRAFWLNRKGRIDADLRLISLPDRLLMDVDVHSVQRLLTGEPGVKGEKGEKSGGGLESFVFAEDVRFIDRTQELHRLSIHGPAAAAIVAACSTLPGNAGVSQPPGVASLQPDQACIVRIADADVVADRWDSAGEIGLELTVPAGSARAVYEALSKPPTLLPGQSLAERALRKEHGREGGGGELASRAGWHAYNTARIEAGTALYNLDFGPTSLPHETGGTLNDRVSFKKGCYLGQEVVARMQSLGHPKQRLVGLRIERANAATPLPAPPTATPRSSTSAASNPFLAEHAEPQTGSIVVEADAPGAAVVGAITSAAASPMLSSATIAFVMMKWSHSANGTKVWVQTAGGRLAATVQESLVFWRRS